MFMAAITHTIKRVIKCDPVQNYFSGLYLTFLYFYIKITEDKMDQA